MEFNFLDILAGLIMVFSTVSAVWRGIFAELISLGSVVLGAGAAILWYGAAASLLQGFGVASPWSDFLGFTGIFLAAIIAGALLVRLIDRTLKAIHLKWADRLMGGVFGLFRGWLINAVLFLALTAFPVGGHLTAESRSGEFFLTSAKILVRATPPSFRLKFEDGYRTIYELWLEETRENYGQDTTPSN